MIVCDGSVLLSPYVESIFHNMLPGSLALSTLIKEAIRPGSKPQYGWRALAQKLAAFYGFDQESSIYMGAVLRKNWANWFEGTPEAPKSLKGIDGPAQRLHRHISERVPNLNSLVAQIVTEEVLQAIYLKAPILAWGPSPQGLWKVITSTFANGMETKDSGAYSEERNKELRAEGISTTALAGLDLWVIDVLAPSATLLTRLDNRCFDLFVFLCSKTNNTAS